MSYIGEERRRGGNLDRRYYDNGQGPRGTGNRRTGERRQEALAGVIMGLTANDMAILRNFWIRYESTRDFNARAGSC